MAFGGCHVHRRAPRPQALQAILRCADHPHGDLRRIRRDPDHARSLCPEGLRLACLSKSAVHGRPVGVFDNSRALAYSPT